MDIIGRSCMFITSRSLKINRPWIHLPFDKENKIWCPTTLVIISTLIGHFQITFGLIYKASPVAHLFIDYISFIHIQIKFIFIWMVGHQASFWKGGQREFRNDLFELLFMINFARNRVDTVKVTSHLQRSKKLIFLLFD